MIQKRKAGDDDVVHIGSKEELTCGLVMPISTQPGCPAEHWTEVREIIEDSVQAVECVKISPRLVSDADDVGVIQKRIVQNLYTSDVVVCDVSCKNPNVMFELGMRLAFDKPTVIIKDDQTDYSFDTGVVEHLTYPRDLRFAAIVQFKKQLGDKVLATYKASTNAKGSSFLKSFGTFHVARIPQDEAPAERVLLDRMEELVSEVARLRREIHTPSFRPPSTAKEFLTSTVRNEERRNHGRARMMDFILEYAVEHAVEDVKSLADDPVFLQWLKEKTPLRKYFSSYKEFTDALGAALELVALAK